MTIDHILAARLLLEININILFIVIMTGFLAYIFINSKRTRILAFYCIMHILIMVVIIGNFTELIASDTTVKWICIVVSNIAKLFFDIIFILYARAFFKGKLVKKMIIILSFTYISLSLIVILSNPIHHLFIKQITQKASEYGILYYFLLATGYFFEVVGLLSILKTMIGRVTHVAYRVAVAITAILSLSLIYFLMCNIICTPVDMLPVVVLFNFTICFIGGYKFGMYDTVSYGSVRSFEMFTEAMLIIGRKGRIIFKNWACSMFDTSVLHEIIHKALPDTDKIPKKWSGNQVEMKIVLKNQEKHFTVSIKPVKTLTLTAKQYILILHDNSEIFTAIHSLKEKNQYLKEMNESVKMLSDDTKKLAVLGERNLMAKEIHDVMGHSLIVALNIMESNRILVETSKDTALQRLRQAISEIDTSLNEIATTAVTEIDTDRAPDKQVSRTCYSLFNERIHLLKERLLDTGITLDISTIDHLDSCSEGSINVIHRICQEAITNSIKHGQANHITISIKVKENFIALLIVDNGKGSSSFTKGNGLIGMEERISSVDGHISFTSFEDHRGFLINAHIPF